LNDVFLRALHESDPEKNLKSMVKEEEKPFEMSKFLKIAFLSLLMVYFHRFSKNQKNACCNHYQLALHLILQILAQTLRCFLLCDLNSGERTIFCFKAFEK